MSKFNDAALLLKRQAVKYEALHEAAKVLDELGSLDDAAEALKKRAEKYRNEEADAIADLNNAKVAAEQFKDSQAAKQKEADTLYASTIADANSKAQSVVADANSVAGQIIADGEAHAHKAVEAVGNKVSHLEETKNALEADIAQLEERRKAVQQEAEVADKKLAKIRDQINSLAKA